MGNNNKRKNAYKGTHSKVSYPKKPGPKKAPKGKQESPQVKANREKSVKAKSKQFTAKLVAALALPCSGASQWMPPWLECV